MHAKILLIEDDNGIRETLCTVLDWYGFYTRGAENGAIGAAYLEQCEHENSPYPCLILLDLNMPIVDGFEFLKLREKAQWKDIPVIAMSAHEKIETKANYFVKKPFEVELLVQKITEILDLKTTGQLTISTSNHPSKEPHFSSGSST